MRTRGRPAGTSQSRELILEAARRHFGAHGYDATTLRGIASDAGVDAALIIHYFHNKEGLFENAADLPRMATERFRPVATLEADEAAAYLVRSYLEFFDDPDTRNAILALVRSAVSRERAAGLLRRVLTHALIDPLSARGGDEAQLRASLIASHLVGVAIMRHVIQLPAVAGATTETLVRLVAPSIREYL